MCKEIKKVNSVKGFVLGLIVGVFMGLMIALIVYELVAF